MQEITTGAGLGALGFWLFVAAIIAVSVWNSIRKRDAQHETLRRLVESGQTIDENLTDKLLELTGDNRELERDLKLSAVLTLAVAPGLVVFGWIMSIVVAEKLLPIMLAVAALLVFIGVGLTLAARMIARLQASQDLAPLDSSSH